MLLHSEFPLNDVRRHQFLCFLSWHVRCESLWRHWSLELTWRENGQRNRPPETHHTHPLNAQRTVTPPDPTPCLPQDASFLFVSHPFKLNQTTESFQWSWNTRRLCEVNTLIAALFLSLSLSFSQCLEYFPQQLSSILHKAVIVEQSWREGGSWMSAVESGHSGPLSQHTNTDGWLTLPPALKSSFILYIVRRSVRMKMLNMSASTDSSAHNIQSWDSLYCYKNCSYALLFHTLIDSSHSYSGLKSIYTFRHFKHMHPRRVYL